MARKKTLSEDETNWVIAYIDKLMNNEKSDFYKRNQKTWLPYFSESEDAIFDFDLTQDWTRHARDPRSYSLLTWIRETLTREEQDQLWRHVQKKRHKKQNQIGSITITKEALDALNEWEIQNGHENRSQSILKLVEIADNLRKRRADIIKGLSVPTTTTNEKAWISINAEAREALKKWKHIRSHQNLVQTILELVTIVQQAPKG